MESEARARIALAESGQARGEPHAIEFARRGDGIAVGCLPRLHRLHAFFELDEAFAQGIEPRQPLVRQLQPLGRAAEQDDAQHILQRADLLSHGGRRHRQLVRRAGKADMARRRVEHAQGVEGKERPLHGRADLGGRGAGGKVVLHHGDGAPNSALNTATTSQWSATAGHTEPLRQYSRAHATPRAITARRNVGSSISCAKGPS